MFVFVALSILYPKDRFAKAIKILELLGCTGGH